MADKYSSGQTSQSSHDDYHAVIDAALTEFSQNGFTATSIDDIASRADIPKKVISSFGTKQDIYNSAVLSALNRLWPNDYVLEKSTLGPVDAMKEFVHATYQNYLNNPESIRLMMFENSVDNSQDVLGPKLWQSSPIVHQLDRILLLGQSLGTFRPGISTEDIYILISSVASAGVIQGNLFRKLYGVDFDAPNNVTGIESLLVDTVISFLTTQLETSQGNSYTHATPSLNIAPSTSDALYTGDRSAPGKPSSESEDDGLDVLSSLNQIEGSADNSIENSFYE